MRRRNLLATAAAAALAAGAWWASREPAAPPEAEPAPVVADYVGRLTCAGCHPAEDRLWRGSHHDLAMQEASAETVLGDFGGATFSHFGVDSKFFRQGGVFVVRTDGPDGELEDFPVAYTFGAEPLQQYLVELPGGRYQALPLAWDSRPAAAGGQRWFHLYPDDELAAGDPLHWTGPNQNWNYMCAECHSTNLVKNYRPDEDRYETTFAEIDVACEACHGPGSRHVDWARGGAGASGPAGKGLEIRFGGDDGGAWLPDPASGTARRSPPRSSRLELETCARCHSRRAPLDGGGSHGRPFLDSHRPMLLDEGLYHPDGQIDGEAYVWGSFQQSRMFHAGVTCSDCHEPHSLALRGGSADAVCSTCHQPSRFATPEHHFHAPRSAGSSCVGCHMPETTYMVVDPRRDHSLRIPRPDLSLALGTPNACNRCHDDRSARWAADAVAGWYGEGDAGERHYGEIIAAGRQGRPGAGRELADLAGDRARPAIVRATALSLLRRYPGRDALHSVEQALADPQALVRLAAVTAAEIAAPEDRLRLVMPLVGDPLRAVRVAAAGALATVPAERLAASDRRRLAAALAEYRGVQSANADRPEGRLNLGWLALSRGDLETAQAHFRQALAFDPTFASAYVNLAEIERLRRNDREGERLLRQGLARGGEDASLYHALGLVLVRRQRLEEAVAALRRSVELAPGEPRYGYALGAALEALGGRAGGA